MNQTEQMREALRQNVRAFRNKKDGEVKYILHSGNNEADWEDVMIIPNLQNEVVDSALAAEPVPLVRLTDDSLISIYLTCKAEWKATNKRERERIAVVFGNALMDAMERVNGGLR